MKGTNRATIHHLNKEKLHMLTTHTRKQVIFFGFFLSFANFYLILVMQIFMDFQSFANFCLVSCKVLKAVKDSVWYKLPLVGVLPQASFRLTAIGWG